MEEFFDLGGTTGIVELHVAAEIIGVSIAELRLSDEYIKVNTDPTEEEMDNYPPMDYNQI